MHHQTPHAPPVPNTFGPFGVSSYPVFGPGRSVYSGRRNGSSKSGIFSGATLLTCKECKQRAVSLNTAETNSRSSFPVPDLPAACWLTHPGSPTSAPPAPLLQPSPRLGIYCHHSAHPHGAAVSPYPRSAAGKPFALPGSALPRHCLELGSHKRMAMQTLTISYHMGFSKAVVINPVVAPHVSSGCHPQLPPLCPPSQYPHPNHLLTKPHLH